MFVCINKKLPHCVHSPSSRPFRNLIMCLNTPGSNVITQHDRSTLLEPLTGSTTIFILTLKNFDIELICKFNYGLTSS